MGIILSIVGILCLPVLLALGILALTARALDFILEVAVVGVLAIVGIAAAIACYILCFPCLAGYSIHDSWSKKRQKKKGDEGEKEKEMENKEKDETVVDTLAAWNLNGLITANR